MTYRNKNGGTVKLRSQLWFDNPEDPDMTALYLERYMNWGLTREELQSGQADHRHRPDGLGPCALQPAPSRAGRKGCAKAFAKRAASPSSFRSTPSRKPASGRPPPSTAISPISAWSKSCSAIPSTASC